MDNREMRNWKYDPETGEPIRREEIEEAVVSEATSEGTIPSEPQGELTTAATDQTEIFSSEEMVSESQPTDNTEEFNATVDTVLTAEPENSEEEETREVPKDEFGFDRYTGYDQEQRAYRMGDTVIVTEEAPKKKKKGGFGKFLARVAAVLVAALLGGIGGSYLTAMRFASEKEAILQQFNSELSKATGQTLSIEGKVENVASAVAKKAMNSVVAVTSLEVTEDWYGRSAKEGMGSGVIVSEDGYILTNSHVIGNGKSVRVFLAGQDIQMYSSSGTSDQNPEKSGYPAKIIWNDSESDLALIKIEAGKTLQAATIGDSSEVQVGETVIAIGNPVDVNFKGTVTQGIVSGLNRSVSVSSESDSDSQSGFPFEFPGFSTTKKKTTNLMTGLIQTDAAINSGNSGGPLLNAKGEVIGINTVKVVSSAGVESLGFAIPIDKAKPVLNKLSTGDWKTVLLGIRGISTKEYEERLQAKLNIEDGIIVLEVEQNSPAYRGGLRANDIVTKIDGKKVTSMNELRTELQGYKKDDRAKITIIRGGEEQTLEVTFDQMNESSFQVESGNDGK